MISDLAFLEINDVKQDDGGVYTCRVDFQRSRTILYQVELFVIVPPPKPTIIDKTTGKITDGIIDHYNEGDTVRLRCQVPRGNPTPKVFWLRKGYIFDKQFKVAPNGTVYNDLTLENISRELYHQQIVCLASNNNITLPSTTVIKAVFNLYPLKTLITTLQRPLTADRKIRMTCKTSGSKPPAVIRWFKENEQLKKVEQREDNGTTVSVLTFTPTASDNGDRLRCVAINPTMPGRKVEDSRQLNIFYFPIVDIRLGKEFGQESVNEGKSVYIECIVDSNPKPIHFDWFYNTIRLETNKSSGIVVANRTLILQRLKAYHRGNYSCAAVNQIGQGESRTIFLNVKHAPLCSRNLLKTYYASLMDNIRISCSVLANPPLVHFSWWFKSNLSSDQIPLKYKQNGTTSITYHQALSESDFGSLYCWAKNAIGDQHDPCVFEIVYARVPESVSNCTVNRDISSLYVKCVEGNDGDLKQSFMMEVTREDDNELIANVSALIKPQFTINLNSIDNNVIINVYAFNYKGRSASCTLSVRALVGNKRLFAVLAGEKMSPNVIVGIKPNRPTNTRFIQKTSSNRDKERKYGAWHMIDTCNWFYTCRNSSLVTRKSDNRWNDMCGSHTCSDSGYHIHHNDEEKTSPARKKFGHSQSTEAGSGVETQTTASIYTDDCSESDKISPDIIPPSQQRVDDGLYIV
ncbi:Kin of IRRE-like protein 3 [Nymphon striatum]|nr:Kin of IRRE-like protein 3 [Nymphon striatum]